MITHSDNLWCQLKIQFWAFFSSSLFQHEFIQEILPNLYFFVHKIDFFSSLWVFFIPFFLLHTTETEKTKKPTAVENQIRKTKILILTHKLHTLQVMGCVNLISTLLCQCPALNYPNLVDILDRKDPFEFFFFSYVLFFFIHWLNARHKRNTRKRETNWNMKIVFFLDDASMSLLALYEREGEENWVRERRQHNTRQPRIVDLCWVDECFLIKND